MKITFLAPGNVLFPVWGATSAMFDLIVAPFWSQNGEKTASENEVGKRDGKGMDFL